jgi:peptidyl-dipeptidase A
MGAAHQAMGRVYRRRRRVATIEKETAASLQPVAKPAASCHNASIHARAAPQTRSLPMLCFRLLFPVAAAALALLSLPFAATASPEATDHARKFVKDHETRMHALDTAANLAWWAANTTGKDEDFDAKIKAQNRIDEALSDPKLFAELKDLKDHNKDIDDKVAARAVDVLYLLYLEKQVDRDLLKQMVEKSNAVEKAFNVYRAKVEGKEMTDSEVRAVLKNSKDSAQRKAVWEASKGVGAAVEADLKELVKLRNKAAVQLGFKNYHAMVLHLNEQDGDQLLKLFDELDDLTREPFAAAKEEIDRKLAANCKVKVEDLMPWHYHDPFFQESPAVFAIDLDAPYADVDIPAMTRDFYAGIGLPVDRVLVKSDLFEKPGKSPHAFCTDIDREGDVRVLGNIKPNDYWASTMLHEFGHSVYSTNNNDIPDSLPYCLRMESHILTTEGVAMMFERMTKRAAFLEKMKVPVKDARAFDAAGAKALKYRLLIFSRWCQVMLRFEKSMYENPDQDLNKLWWDLVEKYQMVKRPPGRSAPDYGSKIHIVSAPVYYHNYMMGELFASQLHHAISKEVFKGADPNTVVYAGEKGVGDFMKKKVFEPGRTLSWNELTKFATGDELNAQAFAEDFKGK